MNNGFQESFPYLQQMTDQFRKIFGDDFVKNLMGSMQTPNWWQQQNTTDPTQGMGAPGPGASGGPSDPFNRHMPGGMPGANGNGWMNGAPAPGWNPFAAGGAQPVRNGAAFPPADVYETRHEVVIVVEVPGMERSSDIRISVFPESVVVKGEVLRKYERTHDALHLSERYTGAFERRISLPARVRKQHAKAIYRSGLLEVRLLKEGKQVDGEGSVLDVDFL